MAAASSVIKYRYIVARIDGSRGRSAAIHEGDPPEVGWQIEITVGRERLRGRVLSVHWPDRHGRLPAEVLVQEER